jgi:hypothetical protein
MISWSSVCWETVRQNNWPLNCVVCKFARSLPSVLTLFSDGEEPNMWFNIQYSSQYFKGQAEKKDLYQNFRIKLLQHVVLESKLSKGFCKQSPCCQKMNLHCLSPMKSVTRCKKTIGLHFTDNDWIGRKVLAGSADDSSPVPMKNFQMMTLPKNDTQTEEWSIGINFNIVFWHPVALIPIISSIYISSQCNRRLLQSC